MAKHVVLDALRQSIEFDLPVRVDRSIRKADRIDGFVIALGTKWVVLHAENEMQLNGFVALRLDGVTRTVVHDVESFMTRGLRAVGQRPMRPRIDPTSVATIGSDASCMWPLLTVYRERVHPDECNIGMFTRITAKTLSLQEISPAAEWDASVTKYEVADVTRVDFGSSYERALWAAGGFPPPIQKKDAK